MSAAEHDAEAAEPTWFSVRCLFRGGDEQPTTYEERITLWRATSFDEAIVLAEAEAADYAELVDLHYLGLAQAYQLFDDVGHGSEVFSLVRDSHLAPEDYLNAYFDAGSERQGHIEETSEEQLVQQRSAATDRTGPAHEGPAPLAPVVEDH